MAKSVLDVGQCMVDGPRLEGLLEELGCEVTSADSIDEALQQLTSRDFDLCLVNRELAFERTQGLELIKAAKEAGVKTPIMLVSDKPDAQQQAVKLGALPGFGKSRLNDQATLDLIQQAMGA